MTGNARILFFGDLSDVIDLFVQFPVPGKRSFDQEVRQVAQEQGRENCLFIHVTLVPYISSSGEHKSKPTQHSVRELQNSGVRPNLIICRCDGHMPEDVKAKISLFCNVKPDCVIEDTTVDDLYEAPLKLKNKTIYPDFKLLDLKRRRTVYWEHFGMMDRPEYAEAAVRKIMEYEAEGLLLGNQLIITMETTEKPLNIEDVERILKQFFQE